MSKLFELVDTVQSQINELISKGKKTQDELSRLEQENFALKKELEQKDNELANVREQLRVSKLAVSVSVDDTEKAELKSQVNELIREVDKCIALLNK